jgi:beta-galactosidase
MKFRPQLPADSHVAFHILRWRSAMTPLRLFVPAFLFFAASTATSQTAPQQAPSAAPRLTLNFNHEWRFYKGEPPEPPSTQPARGNYPPVDPASHAFPDTAWRTLSVPHDWSIEGPFDENAPTLAAGAFLPSGVAWYRKTFTLPPEARAAGKKVFIEFDGVMANSDVYLNKGHLGHRPYGYVPFRYDLTDYLDFDGPNLIAVRTDTSRQPASRWYSGAGINRHVRLIIQNPVHIEPMSTTVSTPLVTAERATVRIKTRVTNTSDRPVSVDWSGSIEPLRLHRVGADANVGPGVSTVFLERNMTGAGANQILPGATLDLARDIEIATPRLWSLEQPALYAVSLTIKDGANTIDAETIPFGIRTAQFKADTGFWLNGKNIKIKGVCLHHDLGALGAAAPASAWDSRLSALKQHGVNAIRAAHAPMPPEFYDACNRLGLLVMDEAFDVWSVGKQTADYHLSFKDWWRRDLEAVMKQNRNHPSIVIWSLGNEIWDILTQNPDPAHDQFVGPLRRIDIARNLFLPMRDLAHQLDPTRPLTIAQMRPNVNRTYDNGFADLMDVIGQNYRDAELAAAHRQNPQRKIIGTENYKTRETWLALRDNPALAGQFLWAGVDYLGEAGRWPNFTAASGILDRTHHPKIDAYERAAWWSESPVVYLARAPVAGAAPPARGPAGPGRGRGPSAAPNWTPENTDPHPESVTVYSNCDEVELFLNDQSLGSKSKNADDSHRQWQVTFASGTLRAVGKNKGAVAAQHELKTAGAPAKVELVAERTTLPNTWDHVVYVRANVTDANGILNPNATNPLKFTLSGPGTLVATDNGSPNDHTPFSAPERRALRGTAIAIVRATADSGTITLSATSDGLAPGTVTIQAAPAGR